MAHGVPQAGAKRNHPGGTGAMRGGGKRNFASCANGFSAPQIKGWRISAGRSAIPNPAGKADQAFA